MKRQALFFLLIILCSTFSSTAQKNNANSPKIILLEDYFVCNACLIKKPAVKKQEIVSVIAQDSVLSEAARKIIPYFTSQGDRFILFSKLAKAPPKTFGYTPPVNASQPHARGFGTYIEVKRGGNSKGNTEFYKFGELIHFLTDSILIFDSLQLSAAGLAAIGDDVLGSLETRYTVDNKTFVKKIPFDAVERTITLSSNLLFGTGLPRSVTDALPVTLQYTIGGEKITAGKTLLVFFASSEEKEDLTKYYKLYVTAFPEWSVEEIADELLIKIIAKYKNASKINFIEWLRSLK
ncbi:MAG TPA: hypothetical protein VGO58_09930 [Chitinophagaceae bacterium]|jgi:hypothetical protein|nr:hypothetical protein [Chitinophagaceae bacterium]